MSNAKKAPKPSIEELQSALQVLIEQGKKEGIIKAADLNALLEKMTLSTEKIEEVYDKIEAMNIQILTNELDLDLGDDLEMGLDGDTACFSLAAIFACTCFASSNSSCVKFDFFALYASSYVPGSTVS